jgi:hypothetical protein
MRLIYPIILILAFTSGIAYSQALKEIFLGLPNNAFGLTREQRDSLVNNFLSGARSSKPVGISGRYLTVYEPRNGFLLMTGAYEGSSHMTFWNLSTGNKLIGVVSGSCGGACSNDIEFLILANGRYKSIETSEVLPKLTFSDFMDVDRMLANNIDVEKEKELFSTYELLYSLPSKGKNITVESQYQELAMDERHKAYNLGSRLELIWQDGKFVKGKHIND